MDVTKLDKMKVVDLRSELQSRGLDTKGVKAVLIERLKNFIETKDEAEVDTNSVSTPVRRGRRTRSMTRSPSPSSVKQAEGALETLPEESSSDSGSEAAAQDQPTTDEDENSKPEEMLETKSEQKKAQVISAQDDNSQESQIPTSEATSDKSDVEEQEEKLQSDKSDSAEEDEDEEEKQSDDDAASMEAEKNVEKSTQKIVVVKEIPMETDENSNSEEKTALDKKTKTEHKDVEEKQEQDKKSEKTDKESKETDVRKKSRSRSRSRSLERRDRSRSRHRSRSESGSGAEQSRDYTKSEFSAEDLKNVAEDEPLIEENQFGLSWFDSDLHLSIDPIKFNAAKQLSHDVFALVWSGARANFGVREGKICYEVRLSEENALSRSHKFRNEPHVRGFRVGFSIAKSTCLQLGETELSFAYCESGKKAVSSQFNEYGKSFGLDDVVGCYLDLESNPCVIKYTLNGEDLGVAFEFDKSELGEENALFPHILCKGYEFQANFADNENLLANTERPTRRRLKKKEPKPVEEKPKEEDKEELSKKEDTEDKEEEANINKNNDKAEEEKAIDNNADTVEEKKESTEKTTNGEEEVAKKAEDSAKPTEADAVEKKAEEYAENAEQSEDDDGPSPNKRQKIEDVKPEKGDTEQKITEKEKRVVEPEEEPEEYEDIVPEAREPVELLSGYELIALIPEEKYVAGPQRPESRKECEVIILIGLPGAGKTHWTLDHVKNHPDKRYDVIGADALIAKMTVDGEQRKTVHKGSWDTLYESCINSLSQLEEIAVKRRRNFILDQTNVYASVQRRKMKGFSNFKRTAVVCLPNEEELKRRIAEKTEKGYVYALREGTLSNLQANFSLPSLDFSWFDDIIYTDLSGDEAKDEVKKINEKGKKSLDANRDKNRNRNRDYQKRDDRRRYDDRRRDYRSDHRSWNDRRAPYPAGGGGGMGGAHNGSRWGSMGGGGNGMMGGYHRSGGGWRDAERNYGGGGGGGGGGNMRGYGGNRAPQRYYGGQQHNQSNWVQNNRNRYDDRFNRSGGGGGGNRFDSYGSGGSGQRDYRDRERDRNGGGSSGGGGGQRRDNYRSMGSTGGHQQRDFRLGHRDNRVEDSRGGYDRSAASASNSSKYNNPAQTTAGYDEYKNGGTQVKSGKWNSYNQFQNQQQGYYQPHASGSWQQQSEELNQYQQQQQYWNYNNMQGYGHQGAEQQQWTEQQQQEWMSWWQEQQQMGCGTPGTDTNQYWQQYMYANQQQAATTASGTKSDGISNKGAESSKSK